MSVGTLWDPTNNYLISGHQIPQHILVDPLVTAKHQAHQVHFLPPPEKWPNRGHQLDDMHILHMYNPSTPTPGMRFFPMLNTTTMDPYIAQPSTTPFRWGWDFNHWVPWILHYPLRPPKQTRRMLQLNLTKPPSSLNESSTSANRFMIFYRSPIPSTSSAMINTGCTLVSCGRQSLVALVERRP
jgi:hypothetical protein